MIDYSQLRMFLERKIIYGIPCRRGFIQIKETVPHEHKDSIDFTPNITKVNVKG